MPGPNLLEAASTPPRPATGVDRRLVVTWQHPDTRAIEPVGFLSYNGRRYEFAYVRHALTVSDFQPLLGFPDLHEAYQSDGLFPLFAQRVMDPRRPDYQRYVSRLGLSEDASPWEQIARSQGRRQGDTLQLFPEPSVDGDKLTCRFLVHGMRHVDVRPVGLYGRDVSVTRDQIEDALARLQPGDPLGLEWEPANPKNPQAIMVIGPASVPVGWVPDLLVADLHRLLRRAEVTVTAEHINGPDAPWHLRLLAKLTAIPAQGFRFFMDGRWMLLADEAAK